MVRWKFPGIIASLAVAVILSQSSCGFQKSPSEIAQEITVLIDGCSLGSGAIFKHENNRYFVMTARHVVSKDVDCLVITSDKERYTAKKNNFTYYQGLDLAVIEFESDKSYPVGKLGKSEAVTIGKTIYVAGAPLPNETIPKRAIRVTEGKIISIPSAGELGYTLVYDNSTKKGMSGGPVLDEKGEVIGIHGRGELADGSKESYGIPIQKFLAYKSEKINLVAKKIEDKNLNYINSIPWLMIIPWFVLLSTGILGSYLLVLILYKIFKRRNLVLVYYNRGIARSDLGDKQSAIADYNKAIEINPNLATAYFNRGVARSDLGDKQSAIADYNKAIEINPNYADAYFNRGVARSDLGDKQSAIADYNKAIEINPNYAYAYYGRGNARAALGETKDAIADFEKAAELLKKDGNEYWYQNALKRLKELRGE